MTADADHTVAVAVSGGRDSIALLHAVCRQARNLGLSVLALHINHGLQEASNDWEAQVHGQVTRWRRRGLPVHCRSLRLSGRPAPGESTEAWARRERYAALTRLAQEAGVGLVLLAHHRRDQAETVLLQGLRGGGPAGLAAMPRWREHDGIRWVRPWLECPREAIEAYARRWRLRWIEDPSNQSSRFDRNRLRRAVWPALAEAFPQAEASLTAVAREAAWARRLADEVAAEDLAALVAGASLDIASWMRLSEARRRASLRLWLERQSGQGPAVALLDRLLVELATRKGGQWPAGTGSVLRLYRGQLQCQRGAPVPEVDTAQVEAGELQLPWPFPGTGWRPAGWGGELRLMPVQAGGLDADQLKGARLVARQGGEQFQRTARSTARSLKKQFQAAAVPAWNRAGPLLRGAASSGDNVLFVPGLGVDARAQAAPGVTQWLPVWTPDAPVLPASLAKPQGRGSPR